MKNAANVKRKIEYFNNKAGAERNKSSASAFTIHKQISIHIL
jgi:hypothetical protein